MDRASEIWIYAGFLSTNKLNIWMLDGETLQINGLWKALCALCGTNAPPYFNLPLCNSENAEQQWWNCRFHQYTINVTEPVYRTQCFLQRLIWAVCLFRWFSLFQTLQRAALINQSPAGLNQIHPDTTRLIINVSITLLVKCVTFTVWCSATACFSWSLTHLVSYLTNNFWSTFIIKLWGKSLI